MVATKLLTAPHRIFSAVSLILLCIALPYGGYGSAEPRREHWIAQHLRENGKYHLSQYEEEGLYFCSVREVRVIEVEFERGFVTFIFDDAAPRFFRQSEISETVLRKLTAVRKNQLVNVLCVHSFYRDDWQARYDEDLSVNHKLLEIIVVGQN